MNPKAVRAPSSGRTTGPDQTVPADQLHGDDSKLIVDHALRFIDEATTRQTPFFVVIWFHTPHTPVVADEAHRSLYPDHPFGEYGQHYHGCITAMDEQIGRLRASLKENGTAQNTMLWYSSDNGPEGSVRNGAGSAGILRGRKRSLYEGGLRVPGLLVWPNRIRSARRTEIACVASDYFPTILDVLKIDLPDRPYDGTSLLPLIDNSISHRSQPIGFQSRKQIAWMDGPLKLYSADNGGTWELYDLSTDPGEQRDLAAEKPDQVKQMSKAALAWVASCRKSLRAYDD